MKTKLFGMLVILMAMFTMAACGSGVDEGESLEGTSWVLVAYRKSSPIESAKPTLKFDEGQVSGNASCNSYGGSYQVEGDKISFGAMFMTEMFCTEPEGVMDQESEYLQMLGSAERFELNGGRLIIFFSDHETLTFDPVE
jgi:heat shock protein HslJ